MCVIIVCKEKRADLELLKKAQKSNDDGGGIAWIENGLVHWRKGLKLNAERIFEISQSKPLPQIIHFRNASRGEVCDELCHPFPVTKTVPLDTGGSCKKVLFHNGTWRDYKKYALYSVLSGKTVPLKGKISDTRYLTQMVAYYGVSILDLILDGDKVAIFSPKKILLFGSWATEDGLKLSNTSFKSSSTVVVYGGGNCPYVGKEDECKEKDYFKCRFRSDVCPYKKYGNYVYRNP